MVSQVEASVRVARDRYVRMLKDPHKAPEQVAHAWAAWQDALDARGDVVAGPETCTCGMDDDADVPFCGVHLGGGSR